MAPLPKTLTFAQRYGDRANNPLGVNGDEILESLRVIYTDGELQMQPPR
jgi:hypothetical protein